MQRLIQIVYGKSFERHRWRNRVHREMFRIDFDKPLGRGKPEVSIA